MDLVAPYSFIPKYKGLAVSNELKGIKNKKGDGAKNAPSPTGCSHLGSNQGPSDYESLVLTALPSKIKAISSKNEQKKA
ncbi:MAG: hypothetical protein ACYDCN_15530 [Bacteroidia bacterium]